MTKIYFYRRFLLRTLNNNYHTTVVTKIKTKIIMELNEQGKLRIDFLLRLVYLIGMIFIIRAVSFDAWNKSMEKEVKCIFSNLSFLGDRI